MTRFFYICNRASRSPPRPAPPSNSPNPPPPPCDWEYVRLHRYAGKRSHSGSDDARFSFRALIFRKRALFFFLAVAMATAVIQRERQVFLINASGLSTSPNNDTLLESSLHHRAWRRAPAPPHQDGLGGPPDKHKPDVTLLPLAEVKCIMGYQAVPSPHNCT